MDLGGAGGAFGAIGGIVGGIIGQAQAAGDIGKARDLQNIANELIQNLQDAPPQAQPVILREYVQQGKITPEQEQQINLGISKASLATGNNQAVQAQMSALQQLQQRSTGGLSAIDRANLNQIQQQIGAQVQGQRQSILQQMQSRGLGGAGAELAAELSAAQGGANTAAQQGLQVGAQAQQAAMQAAQQMGTLGGQIQQQQFGEQFQTGQAADVFRQLDVQNQVAQQQRNVASQNQAQMTNLNLAQNIANANTTQANQELLRQRAAEQTDWQNKVRLAQIKAGQNVQLGGYLQGQGQATAQAGANMGAGIGGLVGMGVGAMSGGGGGGGVETTEGSTIAGSPLNAPIAPAADQAYRYDGGKINDYRKGGKVPGQANVPGDNIKNDTVHAMVSPGEIVVPRTLAESKLGKELLKLINAHNSVKNKLNGND